MSSGYTLRSEAQRSSLNAKYEPGDGVEIHGQWLGPGVGPARAARRCYFDGTGRLAV